MLRLRIAGRSAGQIRFQFFRHRNHRLRRFCYRGLRGFRLLVEQFVQHVVNGSITGLRATVLHIFFNAGNIQVGEILLTAGTGLHIQIVQIGLTDVLMIAVLAALAAFGFTQGAVLQHQSLCLIQYIASGQDGKHLCRIGLCAVIVVGQIIEAQLHDVPNDVISKDSRALLIVCHEQVHADFHRIGVGCEHFTNGIGPLLCIRGGFGTTVGGSLAIGAAQGTQLCIAHVECFPQERLLGSIGTIGSTGTFHRRCFLLCTGAIGISRATAAAIQVRHRTLQRCILHLVQRGNQIGRHFLVIAGKGDGKSALVDLHIDGIRLLRHQRFQFFQNQHQIVVREAQCIKNIIPVSIVGIILGLVFLIVIGIACHLAVLNGQHLLGVFQRTDIRAPAQAGSQQGQHDKQNGQNAAQQYTVLPDLSLELQTNRAGLIQAGNTEIQRRIACTHAQEPAKIIGSRELLHRDAQIQLQFLHHSRIFCQRTGSNAPYRAATANIHSTEVFQHHGQFAELVNGITAAADKSLHDDLSILDKGHAQNILFQQQMKLGSRIDSCPVRFFLRRSRLRLFLAEGNLRIQIQFLLFLAALAVLGETGTNRSGNAVANIIDGYHRQTAGICYLIITAEHIHRHGPKLHKHFFASVFIGLGTHHLPDQLIITHIHREIHIHIGLQQFFHPGCGQIRNRNRLRNHLRCAQNKHSLSDTLEFRLFHDGLQQFPHRFLIADHAVLHRAGRCVVSLAVQEISAVHQCNATFSPA